MQAYIHSSASPLSKVSPLGFAFAGFACVRLVGFRPFGPLALDVASAANIILAALRRFRGPALFHGLRPPSSWRLFWPSSNFQASSATGFQPAALPWPLVPSYSALCRPAFIPALRQSKGFSFWGFGAAPGFACLHCASFKPFYSGACLSSATSYHSCSAAPLPWPSAFSGCARLLKVGRPLAFV